MVYGFREMEPHERLTGHLHMGGRNPRGEEINVTSDYLTRGGKPWIPVMGEFHFCRYDRKKWKMELAKMKAGGITLVSTYLFWIYHEEMEGEFDFSGDRDIRSFVLACRDLGLEVVLRVGPWAHGECRNGGFPDWLLAKPYPLRENNEGYLAQVRKWYGRIFEEVQGLFYQDGGNIVAVQLENEYVGNEKHLAALKEIAISCGLKAPLYTVTGWNSASGARIPVDEVLPVFGGYCEAPWEGHTRRLKPSPHYFFNRMRNDSAIGADLMAVKEKGEDGWQLPYERYPFATCELGGGIQVTHHRRPIIRPMDIYAVALVKLGDGNNLPGYYMYHGGTNKLGRLSTLQESRATGYPNDYPILSYDFQTALSEYGEVREQYRLLNLLHLFLQDFQESFAPLEAVDAAEAVPREDTISLRYGMRTDGKRGYVFVNHYQRLTELADVENAVLDTGSVRFPPIDVRGEISFFFPFGMELVKSAAHDKGTVLKYATAQPICRMGNTFFFVEITGIRAAYCVEAGGETRVVEAVPGKDRLIRLDWGAEGVGSGDADPGKGCWVDWGEEDAESSDANPGKSCRSDHGAEGVRIVTLTWEEARFLRRLSVEGEEGLYLGNGWDLCAMDGKLYSAEPGIHTCYRWNGERFEELPAEARADGQVCVQAEARKDGQVCLQVKDQADGQEKNQLEAHAKDQTDGLVNLQEAPLVKWSFVQEPPFEPPYGEELQIGSQESGKRALTWKKLEVTGEKGFVTIDEDYDVAQIYGDGELLADNYYIGLPWRVPAQLLSGKECYLVMSERRDDFYREF